MTQKNLEVGNLVLLKDHPTARGQYPLARVVEVFPNAKGVVRRVRIMTANANKLDPDFPCNRTTLDRDTTKLALLEFPAVNPISEILHVPESNTLIDEIPEINTLTPNDQSLSTESSNSDSITCKKGRKE